MGVWREVTCLGCGWKGQRYANARHCSRCRGTLVAAGTERPTVAKLQAIIRSLAERVYVQSEELRRSAERESLGRYRCGCPVKRSDKVQAFCDTHYQGFTPPP